MKNTDYLLPSVAAASVAILFPLYWLGMFPLGGREIVALVWQDIEQISSSDAVFLLLGVLTVYVYYSLMRILNDRLNYQSLNIVLWIMIAVNALFTGTIVLDLIASTLSADALLVNRDALVGTAMAVGGGSMVLFGVLDILIGIVLLRASVPVPSVLKIFAVITLIQGCFEITLFFSFMTLIIFPLGMVVLAVYFISKPDSIEVV
jgi:hypothetical protein